MGMDKGLTVANRMKTEARIWTTIDDNELDILATHLVERGQVNPMMATVTRQLSRNYTQYQVGIITVPRLIQSYMHIVNNGGLDLSFRSLIGGSSQ